MTKTKSQKVRAKAKGKRGKRLLDNIGVTVSMPGSSAKTKLGNNAGKTTVGVNKRAMRSMAAPAAIGPGGDLTTPAKITNFTQDGARISGRDYLTAINVNSHNAGDIRFQTLITPYMIPNSRMAQLATIFQKWRIRKMIFHYVTSVSSATAGQLINYIDFDPASPVTNSQPTNVNIASAHSKSIPFSVWQDSDLTYGRAGQWLFTNPNGEDQRLDTAGQFFSVCATNFSGTVALGTIYVEYVVEFALGDSSSTSNSASVGTKLYSQVGNLTTDPFATPVIAWNFLGLRIEHDADGTKFIFPPQLGVELYLVILVAHTAAGKASPTYSKTAEGFSQLTLTGLSIDDFPPVSDAVTVTGAVNISVLAASAGNSEYSFKVEFGPSIATTDQTVAIFVPMPNTDLNLNRTPVRTQLRQMRQQIEVLEKALQTISVTPPTASTLGGPVPLLKPTPSEVIALQGPAPISKQDKLRSKYGIAVFSEAAQSRGLLENYPNLKSRCANLQGRIINRILSETGVRHFCALPDSHPSLPKSCQFCSSTICDYVRNAIKVQDLYIPVMEIRSKLENS